MTQQDDDRVLHVRSNAGGAVLEVERTNIRLSRRGLDASVVVYELETGEITRGLASFIASLARDWRGWQGDRVWSSLEGEFKVTARHDGLGTVELIVRLGQLDPTREGVWTAQASLFLDAGGLDVLARNAAAAGRLS